MIDSVKTFLITAIIFFSCMLGLTILTSFTTPEPPAYSIQRITSYDGVTVYSYGSYVIVKTDNSVSISN